MTGVPVHLHLPLFPLRAQAGGRLGKFILSELQKNPQFTITALTRAESTSKIPDDVRVAQVDYEKHETLVAALQGQEVVISTLAVTAPKGQQNKLVDAAAEAGVRWIIPNGWGYDVRDEEVARENLVTLPKDEERAYIEQKGLKWVSIECGFWYEYSLSGGQLMFGIDAVGKKATLYGGGRVALSTSTWAQTGRAVAALLALPEHPEKGQDHGVTISRWTNEHVHINSFTLNQRQMLDAVQKQTSTTDADWTIDTSTTARSAWEQGMQLFKSGDWSGFALTLYSRMFFDGEPGNADKLFGLDNDLLGLPSEDLAAATQRAVELAQEQYIPKQLAEMNASK